MAFALKKTKWRFEERKGQKQWTGVIEYPLLLDETKDYRVRITSGKHRVTPGKTQSKKEKRALAIPPPKIEKPSREPLKIERPPPLKENPYEHRSDPWDPRYFWENPQQTKEREEERLKREEERERERLQRTKRRIRIAYQGSTWNIEIDGTTTEEGIRQEAEGLSRERGLILREDKTHREEGLYAFKSKSDAEANAESEKRAREREEKQRLDRMRREELEAEYAPKKPQPPWPKDRPVWGSTPSSIETPKLAWGSTPRPTEPPSRTESKTGWGRDSRTPTPRDDLSDRTIVRQIHWLVKGKKKSFEKSAPGFKIVPRGEDGNRNELLVVQTEARSIDFCGVFEQIENQERGQAVRQQLVIWKSVLAESRGVLKVRLLLEESEVQMHEWNRREAARAAFASEFEERETTFERRTIRQSPLAESRIEMTEAIKTQTELQESESWAVEKRAEMAIWVQNWTELQMDWNKRTMRCRSVWRKGTIRTSGEAVETRRTERRAIETSGVMEKPEETEPLREEAMGWLERAKEQVQWEREQMRRKLEEQLYISKRREEELIQEQKRKEGDMHERRMKMMAEAEAYRRRTTEDLERRVKELEQERDELKHKLQLLQEQERSTEAKQKWRFW
jgi:hypothetical protein